MSFLEYLREHATTKWNISFQTIVLTVVFIRYIHEGAHIPGALLGAFVVTAIAYGFATIVIYGIERAWTQYSAKR